MGERVAGLRNRKRKRFVPDSEMHDGHAHEVGAHADGSADRQLHRGSSAAASGDESGSQHQRVQEEQELEAAFAAAEPPLNDARPQMPSSSAWLSLEPRHRGPPSANAHDSTAPSDPRAPPDSSVTVALNSMHGNSGVQAQVGSDLRPLTRSSSVVDRAVPFRDISGGRFTPSVISTSYSSMFDLSYSWCMRAASDVGKRYTGEKFKALGVLLSRTPCAPLPGTDADRQCAERTAGSPGECWEASADAVMKVEESWFEVAPQRADKSAAAVQAFMYAFTTHTVRTCSVYFIDTRLPSDFLLHIIQLRSPQQCPYGFA